MSQEPITTPSILATIPDLLKDVLSENISNHRKGTKNTILISSNSLANRFIFERWEIRSSRRRNYKNLFLKIREQCRNLFRYYERVGYVTINVKMDMNRFGVFKFDEVRGNIILGFVLQASKSPFV